MKLFIGLIPNMRKDRHIEARDIKKDLTKISTLPRKSKIRQSDMNWGLKVAARQDRITI
jgi:hypothetical protein